MGAFQVLREALLQTLRGLLHDTDASILSQALQHALPGKAHSRHKHGGHAGGAAEGLMQNASVGVQGIHFSLDFWKKIHSLHEVLDARRETFVIGPAGSGKSTVWRALARGVMHEYVGGGREKAIWHAISPNAMPTQFLLGHYDSDGTQHVDGPGKWVPGCLSNILRNYAAVGDEAERWVVLDGQVDVRKRGGCCAFTEVRRGSERALHRLTSCS